MRGDLEQDRLELWLVALIALHSLAVGVSLLCFTDWSVTLGGWERVEPRFFARQAGVFHIVVAIGYLGEYLRYRGVGLLVLAKSAAVLFLFSMWLSEDPGAWAIPLSALADGLMAVVVVSIHHGNRSRRVL